MERKTYTVQLGIEHPRTGHWLDAGADLELADAEATMLLASGHVAPKADQATTGKKAK